jgi:hypothetical protein
MFKQIRPLAFRLNPEIPTLPHTCATLTLPKHWKALLKQLKANALNRPVEKTSIPIDSLNRVIRAIVPDVVAIEPYAGWAEQGWLYSAGTIDPQALLFIIHAWVKHAFIEAQDDVRQEVLSKLRVEDLQWQVGQLDLACWQVNQHGTAITDRKDRFVFLPDVFAALISKPEMYFPLGPYSLRFRRTPIAPGQRGAELISWPPILHEDNRGSWPFSVLLTITAQTVPFQSYPVIHCDIGVRRWVDRQRWLPRNRTSVYLRTSVPWVPGLHLSESIQAASLRRKPDGMGDFTIEWCDALLAILNELRPGHPLPAAQSLVDDPLLGFPTNGSFNAAITYRTAMPYSHGVGAGLMPGDRKILLGQLDDLFSSTLQLVEPFHRTSYQVPSLKNPFFPQVRPTRDLPARQSQRRALIREAVGPRLTIEIRYQSPVVRDALLQALNKELGLSPDGSKPFHDLDNQLQIDVLTQELGGVGDALIGSSQRKRRDDQIQTHQQRLKDIATKFPCTNEPTLTLVEIAPPGEFDSGTDPKSTLRIGLSSTGRLSQFIVSERQDVVKRKNETEVEGSLVHRARSSLLDGLRQLGVQLPLPPFKGLPQDLNLFGVWLINHYRTKNILRESVRLPVFIHIDPKDYKIKARFPGIDKWLPYSEALRKLAEGDGHGARYAEQAMPFIRQIIKTDILAFDHSLLLCHAQNLRQAWGWLENTRIAPDGVDFGDEKLIPTQDLPGLRLVRVRDSQRHETPEWFGYDTVAAEGFSKGLFQINQRVFASTYNKPRQFNTLSPSLSKFDEWTTPRTKRSYQARPDSPAWNPGLFELTVACLQPEDRDPTPWAALVHTLRHAAPHYDEALALPLPLHLAKLMEEYVFTVEDEDDE